MLNFDEQADVRDNEQRINIAGATCPHCQAMLAIAVGINQEDIARSWVAITTPRTSPPDDDAANIRAGDKLYAVVSNYIHGRIASDDDVKAVLKEYERVRKLDRPEWVG